MVLLVHLGCCRPGPPPAAASDGLPATSAVELPFAPSEMARYDISLAAVPMAVCEVSLIRTEEEGRACLAASYHVQSAPTVSAVKRFTLSGNTLIDSHTLLPIRSEKTSVKPKKQKHDIVLFDRTGRTARVTKIRSNKPTRQKDVPFEVGLDLLSALTMLRATRPEMKEPLRMKVLSGDDFHELIWERKGSGKVTVKAGTFDTIELSLSSRELPKLPDEEAEPWRTVTLWVTEDSWMAVRCEVRLLAGEGVAELTQLELTGGR
jgi:hypothetical protein